MSSSRSALSGRRGWSAVVGLSTVLVVLVAGQLPAASAADRPLAPVASALGVLVPSLAPSPGVVPALLPAVAPAPADAHLRTAAADAARLPGSFRRGTQPAAQPPAAVVKPAAAKTAPAPRTAAPAKRTAAKAPAPGLCSAPGWQQRRGQAALASLRAGAERTGFRVEFKAARAGYMGLTHLQERRIEMFVRPCGTQSAELLRHVMAHELGHAYDTTHMNASTRRAWQVARGIPLSTPWYGCSGCSDFATPAGDFAEVYAQWARGASSNRSQLAGDVAPAQLTAYAKQFFGA